MTAETAPTQSDSDVILPDSPEELVLNGIPAEVKRLRTREFLSLMKVLLRGVGGDLMDAFAETDEKRMQGRLTGLILVAIPNAEHEFIVFLQRVVQAKNEKQRAELFHYLENPDIDDLMTIARIVIEQEAQDFAKLGKDAKAWWMTIRETVTQGG